MRTHIVPRFYLSGFVDKHSKVWTYNKILRKFFHTRTKNTGVETDFYTKELENQLATEIESPTRPILQKIRQQEKITLAEKSILSVYMANFLVRVPYGRVVLKSVLPATFNQVFANENISNILGGRTLSPSEKEKIKELRRSWENNDEKTIEWWASLLKPRTFKIFLAGLESMTWQFLTYTSAPAFLTSDNPVFFFRDLGLGHTLSEVTFPISQNIALWATWNKEIKEDYVPINQEIAMEINRRTAIKATRNLFSPVKSEWIEQLAHQEVDKPQRIIVDEQFEHVIRPF